MSVQQLDQPTAVRKGEELNSLKLEGYLQQKLGLRGPLEIEQFPSGFSNLTYLLRMGEQELVLRRPPFGANIKSAHDMGREYTVLSHLQPVYGKAPRPLLYCDDDSVLGAPFYVMERVKGIILRDRIPDDMVPPPALMRRIAASLVDSLVALHAVDIEAAGLANLGQPQGYVRRQIEGWTRRYFKACTDAVPDIENAAQWLAENMPPESSTTLIHNDYKYDNIVLNPDDRSKIIAILDWEMATIGDPLMDLGSSLGYWVQADDPEVLRQVAFGPTMLPGNPTRAELVDLYTKSSGRTIENPVFYHVYGLFKLAVIGQQIYKRYKLGYTRDARFGRLNEVVRVCGQMAIHTIESNQI